MDPIQQTFAGSGESALALDIFKPAAPSKETAVLLLHGGGWRMGDRSFMHGYARYLAGRGFTSIAVQYRLLDQAPWPAQLEDVVAAAKWARSHAKELGVRSDRIVLEGFSAGAHLALMAGAKGSDVAAVVAFFPPTRLAVTPSSSGESDTKMLLGPDAKPEAAEAASPIAQVHSAYPPTLLLHGSADWMIAPDASRAMYDRLIAVGAKAELHIFFGEHHEFSIASGMIAPVQDLVADFLRRTVIDPQGHTEEMLRENPFAGGPQAFAARMGGG